MEFMLRWAMFLRLFVFFAAIFLGVLREVGVS
jgi:hypothetical protein